MNDYLPSPLITYATHVLCAGSVAAAGYAFRASLVRYARAAWRPDEMANAMAKDLMMLAIAAGVAVAIAAMLVGAPGWGAAVLGAIVALIAPRAIRKHRRERYRQAFDASLAESLQTVASSLKAGLTLRDSLYVASQNSPPAFSVEVSNALKEYRFGLPIEQALDKIRIRVGTPNASIAFGSMIISSRLGGRLPEMLKQIVRTVRERERVEGRLKALTAQGRAQAFLLCAAPPVLGIGMYLYDPGKMALLTDYWVGQILLALAIVLEIVGIAVTSRVMKLEI